MSITRPCFTSMFIPTDDCRRLITRTSSVCAFIAVGAAALAPDAALAHAFGVRYDLPIPLWLYLVGAGAVVALSFVAVVLFARAGWRAAAFEWAIDCGRAGRRAGRIIVSGVRCLSVALFIAVWSAAAFGTDETLDNLAPTTIWIVWWLGLSYVSALFGNVWGLINPLDTMFRWAAARFPVRPAGSRFAWPSRLGSWPAAALLLLFAWIEMISEFGETPRGIAWMIAVYAAISWFGMAMFGRRAWLRHCDVFAVYFGLIGRFGVFAGRLSGGSWPRVRRFWLRVPAMGLVERHAPIPGHLAFVIVMLASVGFDGFRETPAWESVLSWVAGSMTLRPLLLGLRDGGVDLLGLVETVGLVLTPLVFFVVYAVFAWLMAVAVRRERSSLEIAGWLASSLVPIAIAYHLAHYVSYVLLAGQLVAPLISDPFGFGWNLFGTAAMTIDVTVVNARMVWYVAVIAVVLGHVAAVFVSHATAMNLFRDDDLAQRSQIPMLVLMVIYTMLSLWILAQPVVITGDPL